MIKDVSVRERYVKLLLNAHIATEIATDSTDATVQLTTHIHALLFTDQLDLIRAVRQLSAGAATHVVFVGSVDSTAISEALRAGANDAMSSEARGEQFWAQLTMARRIVSFASSLRSAVTDNRILSTIDALTRCGNRRYFEQQFPQEVARAQRLRRPLALLMCDIDHFKAINDRYGHQLGDEVLREVGDRLVRGLRMGEDWVARIGGEEFAIVLPETGRFKGLAVAGRLCNGIRASAFGTSAGPLAVTASFGVCGIHNVAPDVTDLRSRMIAAADGALYQSKREGRNRVTDANVFEGD
jgi:two-component system cell cycle response regulator